MENENNVELPKIEIEPIHIPATEEKNYNQMCIDEYIVRRTGPKQYSIYAILRPENSVTGDMLVQAGTEEVINIPDVLALVSGQVIEPKITPPTLMLTAQASGLTLASLKSYLADKAQPDPEPVIEPELPVEPEPTPEPIEPEPEPVEPEPEPIIEEPTNEN